VSEVDLEENIEEDIEMEINDYFKKEDLI